MSQGSVLPRPLEVSETSRCLGCAIRPQDTVTTPALQLTLTITDPAHMQQDLGEQRSTKPLRHWATWHEHGQPVACWAARAQRPARERSAWQHASLWLDVHSLLPADGSRRCSRRATVGNKPVSQS